MAGGLAIPGVSADDPAVVMTAVVPPQVLKVRTRLENPTLYHVIESRKRQVRQFLEQEHQPPPAGNHHSAPPGGFVVIPPPPPSAGASSDPSAIQAEVCRAAKVQVH